MDNNEFNVQDNTIISTYYGGCGHSQMVKMNIIRKIIVKLNESQIANSSQNEFKSEVFNLQIQKQNEKYQNINQKIKSLSFKKGEYKPNLHEFNIYLVKGNNKYLVYTSDQKNTDVFVKLMMSNEEVINTVVNRVNELISLFN